MNTLLRGVCLAIYLLAFVGIFIELPFGITAPVQYGTVILLGGHVVETIVAFKSVKLYKGPLIVSVALTLLFGLLHWMPLSRENARAAE